MQRWGSAVAFRKKSICTLHFRFLCSVPSIFYEQLTKQGDLLHDTEQTRVIEKYLDRLFKQLDGYQLPNLGVVRQESDATNEEPQDRTKEKEILVPRGLYIHGQVGTGKSMLMDLFFQHVRVQHKRRVHFNKFMLEVHERIQIEKKKQLALYGRQRNIVLDPNRDVIATVANQIAEESHLLCFDEFQVTDIADALIMRKLFGIFFSRGLVMVATSNTHPKNLYKDGTNREYFLPFLDQLARHSRVVGIRSAIDYRRLCEPTHTCFFYPTSDPEVQEEFSLAVHDFVADEKMPMDDLRIPVMMGRSLNVQGTRSGLCRINFQELCNTEKGAADYKALCEHFHTVILEDIPQMDMRMHDQARRFITLVDEIYEHRTRFIFSSSVVIEQIFAFEDNEVIEEAAEREKNIFRRENDDEKAKEQGIPITSSWDGPVAAYNPAKMPGLKVQNLCSLLDLHIAFNRAVSRIMEMRSENYLAKNRTLRKIRQHTLHNTLA